MPLSLRQRPELLRRLRERTWDILVVGGGITGAGIARDAALRGLRVALVERGDFASGTSSRSSKLIHGGLRYLEQGDVGLVYEAVRERQRLLKLAPHLAHPQSFVVPVFRTSKHSVLVLDLGLTIYDVMAWGSGVLRHRAYRAKRLLDFEPLLKRDGLRGGVRYFDAQTNDARLVMANIRGAHRAGAACLSRVSFEEPVWENGRVRGACLHDSVSGESFEVSAGVLTVAAGPFTDDAMARFGGRTPLRRYIRPSKGVHVVVPRARLPLQEAVVMTAEDGRVVFGLPWPAVSVIGTTDTSYSGDLSRPTITAADADYLLRTANRHFDPPGRPLERDDITSGWAGIRPLAIGTRDDDDNPYNSSREHVIETDPRGMVMIAGGKLTTYRVMAEEAVDAALAMLPRDRTEGLSESCTASRPLPGAERLPAGRAPLEVLIERLAAQPEVSGGVATHLVRAYGSDAEVVIGRCREIEDGFAQVLPGCRTRWGEVRWVIDHEMPLDLVDLAVRRLPLYYTCGDRLLARAGELAARFCAWSGLPDRAVPSLVAGLREHIELQLVGVTRA